MTKDIIPEKVSINRLIQDIEEGIIVVDNYGTIKNINPKALDILNINDDYTNKKYIELMENDTNNNDEFHQMVIDVVDDKKIVHKRESITTRHIAKKLYILLVLF